MVRIMNTTTTERPIDRVLAPLGFPDEKRSGYYITHCKSHPDRDPSLYIRENEDGNVIVKCLAGCTTEEICTSLGITVAALFKDYKARPYEHPSASDPCTVLDIAFSKLLHPNFLNTLGLVDFREGVKIPYYLEDGKEYARYRVRKAIAKPGGPWLPAERTEEAILYGLWKLKEARLAKKLVLVEGESDCWTLWRYDIPALGFPGADMTEKLRPQHVAGIDEIYISQEPGQAGQNFVRKLVARLKVIGYQGKMFVLDLSATCNVKDPSALHCQNPKAFKETFKKSMEQAKEAKPYPNTVTLAELMGKTFAPVQWAIPGILPEGLTMLAGKPKQGKSWMALGFALGISAGGCVLGKQQVEQGDVLYLALEDRERRLQKRASIVLGEGNANNRLHFVTEWPRMGAGGIEALGAWIADHKGVRLIIIDTWAKFGPRAKGRAHSLYEEQTDALQPLQELAGKAGIAILVIHHLRKMVAEDVSDEISGTTGIAGGLDNFLILKRDRGSADAVIHVDGRDIEEPAALALRWDASMCSWFSMGNAEEMAKTKERQDIIDILAEYPDGLKASEMSDLLKKRNDATRYLLAKLKQDGLIIMQKNYKYVLSPDEEREEEQESTVSPSTPSSTHTPSTPSTPSSFETDAATPASDLLGVLGAPILPLAGLNPPVETDEGTPARAARGASANGTSHNGHHASMPPWLIPGTRQWNREVARSGIEDVMARRNAALAQRKQAVTV